MEKPSVACGRWSLSKVVTHVGRLTGDQAVIVAGHNRISIVSVRSADKGIRSTWFAQLWSLRLGECRCGKHNGSEQHCSCNLVGRLDSCLATRLLLTVDLAVCCPDDV
ncbi:hypothetical protein D3D02_15900 [Halobellus sp. Atlit-38R]|nr:hypothetical protein D3D02_15900 [Halobellus sp. Atlit-38R]